MPLREDYAAKARRLLGEARLMVRRVDGGVIVAECRGDSGEVYSVGHTMRRAPGSAHAQPGADAVTFRA